ncbi:MAG: radical SAM protein, partial [Deltaproteobacteria bacterium]|nr:radical SAM protein [Deltaproteobacteria bacterium]
MEELAPFLISWNITKRCNLKCQHCYLDASELEGTNDASTADAIRTIDEIASISPSAMLIITGGEPLLRKDLFALCSYATGKGLMVVLGTNATLIDNDIIEKLINVGVKGIGISLDSVTPAYHDRFRGMDGAWSATMKGIDALRQRGLDFQIQLTVTKENRNELPSIIRLAVEKGARAVNIFFLVCTGRGQGMSDLSASEYEEVLAYLVGAEKEFADKIMVRARCAPHFLRVASRLNPESALLKGETSGCIAGRGYLRITPEGYVTPCPYIPA